MKNKTSLLVVGVLVLILLWSVISIYPDWLWFGNLGFSSVFWTMILSKFGFGFVVWVVLIIILSLNLYVAQRLCPERAPGSPFRDEGGYFSQIGLSGKAFNYLLIAFLLLVSFIIASKGSAQWDTVLRYLYQQPFGL